MSFRNIVFFVPAVCLLAQTPPPVGQPAPVSTPVAAPAAAPAPNVPPDKVVLTVGDYKLTAAQFDEIINALPEQVRAQARGAGKAQFANTLVQLYTLAGEAKRRQIDQTPAFKAISQFQVDNILATMAFDQLGANKKPTEEQLKKYYDDHKADFEEVRARHILIRTPGSPVPLKEGQKETTEQAALAKANDARARVQKGEDFAKVAADVSDDSGAATNGGELGSFGHNQMVPEFENAAFALKPGELSAPVKTQFGYHIIQVESKETKSFDDVRKDLEQELGPAEAQKAVQELVQKTPHSLDPDFFPQPAAAK